MESEEIYTKICQADEKERLRDVAGELIEAAFNSSLVDIDYKTTDVSLNVGERTVDASKFIVDGVRVQNIGMSGGAKVDVRASYYTRAKYRNETTPAPSMSPRDGENVTVDLQLSLTVDHNAIQGDGLVMFRKGYD